MVELSGSLWSRYLALRAAGDDPPACLHRGWRPSTKARCEPDSATKVSHLPGSVTPSVMSRGSDVAGDRPRRAGCRGALARPVVAVLARLRPSGDLPARR